MAIIVVKLEPRSGILRYFNRQFLFPDTVELSRMTKSILENMCQWVKCAPLHSSLSLFHYKSASSCTHRKRRSVVREIHSFWMNVETETVSIFNYLFYWIIILNFMIWLCRISWKSEIFFLRIISNSFQWVIAGCFKICQSYSKNCRVRFSNKGIFADIIFKTNDF